MGFKQTAAPAAAIPPMNARRDKQEFLVKVGSVMDHFISALDSVFNGG